MISDKNNNPWLVRLRNTPGARLRLFCFPYAGGGASVLRNWFDGMPEEIDVYAVQLPGRERRLMEPLFTHLSHLVQSLAQSLEPWLVPPFAFYGHSMGALIGFELARHLRRMRMPVPVHLFVSGHRAPHLPASGLPIHQLPDPDFIDELRKMNGTPEEVLRSSELMQLVLPALRADFMMCETYTYAGSDALLCPITAMGGMNDERASIEQLRAWAQQTRGDFSLRMFDGDHFFPRVARPLMLDTVYNNLKPFWGTYRTAMGQ